MPQTTCSPSPESVELFTKETVLNGKTTELEFARINGQVYSISPGPVRVASLEDDWYEDVIDPVSVIEAFSKCKSKPDVFTFWQRVPDTEPKYDYPMEWESLAVLPIQSFDHWWNKQVKAATRNMVRKSQKLGVETREAPFDDEFVRGMVGIFNESPVRQGFKFWHYGKDFETIKREFSRFIFREDLIGSYYQGELIGFAMVANAGKYAVMGQFIAMMKHRDKAIPNALMAKTVELCEKLKLPYLVYTTWRDTSLVDFKRHSGFQEMKVPRYFVPLTSKGRMGMKVGLHRGIKETLPPAIKRPLKRIRKVYYNLRWGRGKSA